MLVVWAIAWSVTPGRIAEDTKNDLYVDPWGFLARALHLWDPQVTWGGLSNQGYGYLFPMGPFFGLGSEIAPVWVVQRLWWSVLLTAAFVGMLGLLRALGVGTHRTRIVGALAYVLAPRVLSSIGGLSAEIQPQLLAPLVLWPLVLATKGHLSTPRAATLSGLAALCCGGVNATATLCALVPAGLWLITRQRWWRSPLTWSWAAAMVAATAWWLVPLLIMSRYAPPFLDWIENARAVMRPIGMLDVARGTTHWLGHIVTPGGAWWPAGHQLATSPQLIVLTTVVAGLGLAGLAMARIPERRWLWTSLLLGGVLLTVAHSGPFSSPVVTTAQAALDGPLAPLRNIHKFDLLVRLPLAVGLVHLLGRVSQWRPQVAWHRSVVMVTAVVAVIGAGAPAFTGAIAVRGSFERMPQHWVDAGRWLDANREGGQALLLPAANFGEYFWGRTIDEPLRPLTTAPYAVRDAVPLAPAGTIRMLDEIERRLQSGRSMAGGAEVLRRAGVGHLVVRNDLATHESGQPPVALARSSVRSTPGVQFARGFGQTFLDAAGERVFPVEIYALPGTPSGALEIWASGDVDGASGATEDLLSLADAQLLGGPVVFDGDRSQNLDPEQRVETDGYRTRARWFGAPRGQDLTSSLTARAGSDVPDYLPWDEDPLRSAVTYDGIADVSATSSVAEELTFAGLRPAHRPFAALDGDPATSWATMWDDRPSLNVVFAQPASFDHVNVTGLGRDTSLGETVSRPTRVRVTTDQGSTTATVLGRPTRIELPGDRHSRIRIQILETESDAPGTVITGLSEVQIPGVSPGERIALPRAADADEARAIVLSDGLRGRDGCTSSEGPIVCISGTVDPEQSGSMARTIAGARTGSWIAAGTLVPGLTPTSRLQGSPDVSVAASSARNGSAAAAPSAIVDGDDRTAWSPAFDDETPELTLDFARDVTLTTIRFQTRDDWAARAAPAVVIRLGGREVTRRVQPNGVVEIPATTGRRLDLEFVRVPGDRQVAPNAALELEELDLADVDIRPPAQQRTAECGQGPRLVVDGRAVPTSATVPRGALFGVESGTWRACEPVAFGAGEEHSVEVGAWQGFTPRAAVLTRQGAPAPVAQPQAVATSMAGTTWRGQVVAAPQARVLVMDQNASAGWAAHVGGVDLEPQVIDGRRQGFILPPGLAGALEIEFGPDAAYRASLLAGLALATALLVAAAVAARTRTSPSRTATAPESTLTASGWRGSPPWAAALAAVMGGLIAGAAGAAAALVGAVLAQRFAFGFAEWVRASIVAAGLAVCGVIQAVIAPGSLGGALLEGALRLAIVAVVSFAALAPMRRESRSEA
ncbi:hypothetical protein N802_17195 [Knoellia sinensis KCTC 19936]|uniref:F5/8 type C domain-containing protein n=2 Tax=Knoellia TaxID=136099 RepID=A0A0A0J9H8_9MICO|nr:hypothetical protein N802_17195 [Knoellia sinensis KCTC 19936]